MKICASIKSYATHIVWAVVVPCILVACTQLSLQGQQLPTHTLYEQTESAVLPTLTSTLRDIDECIPLSISGLPAAKNVLDSHILFLVWNSDEDTEQVWAVSMEDGSRRLILDGLPSPHLSIAFLEDGYRFLLAGSHSVWLSDLSSTPLVMLEEPSLFLSSFRPYSPMWDSLAVSGGMPEGFECNIGRLHSPDDQRIAVWLRGDAALRIIDKESDTEVQVLPTEDLDDVSGSWSPDGEQFAFSYYCNASSYNNVEDWYTQLYIVNADGTELHTVTERNEHAFISRPNWSPDGRQIVFSWSDDPTTPDSLRMLTVATGEVQVFNIPDTIRAVNTCQQDRVVWSPDGKWIAFITLRDDIHALNLETGELYCIIKEPSIRVELMNWH
jgi:hypothetical protein